MTGPRLDRFEKALERFKKTLSPNLVDEFAVCSLQDVRDICRNIQDAHGQERNLRHMRRLAAFIEAMEQFGKVIEVFTNVNEIVCFIWGPIKFLLGIAKTYMDSFDRLLDMYDKIGNVIPGLLHYQAVFEEHPPLATVLEDYYSDILGFHQAALTVFRRPRWKELFHSTWKTFDSKFRPILQSLEKRRELLESEKGSATLYEVQRLRQDILNIYTKERNQAVQEAVEKHRREVYYAREKLEAPNYKIDQEMSTEDRHGHNSGTWIFEDPSFSSWSNHDTSGHGILYVNGIPGAGKTTLMSVVIEQLLDSKLPEEKRHCVAYFYFKQKQLDKVSHNSSLRALLLQLVERDSIISDHLFEKISSIEGVNLRSTKVLESLIKAALESYRLSYIVLDGLDECAPNEAAKSVTWFLSLINGGLAGTNAALRVLFCGQRDGTLDRLLSDQSSISLESSGHVEDIRQYCRGFAGKIREKFDITLEMEEEIILKVTNESQGMFLYARVVLENLWNQTRRSRLREEIEPGTFPLGIEKAYERVAVRVFGVSSTDKLDVKKILGWIICARRLLRWREIQSLFCIDPVKGDADYEERRLRVTCKELCGSFIDVHHATNKTGPEDIIKIVHETAREYLIRKKLLDVSLEHARLAIFCARYLTSEPFAYRVDDEEIVTHALKGYYALQDYAVQFWFDHFQNCAEFIARLDPDLYLEAMSAAKVVLVTYGLPSKIGKLPDTECYEEVTKILARLPSDGRERSTYFNMEHRTSMIRNAIETLDWPALHPIAKEILTDLHGNTAPYKCPKPWCEYFTAGFGNVEDRKQHINRHDRPFRCPFDSCFASQLGYDTHAKLDRHQKDHHPDLGNDNIRFPKMATKKIATIWMAATQGDLATISSLLDSGIDINKANRSKGETPIYLAAKFGHFKMCEILLNRGANIDLPEPLDGRTALHEAVAAGNLDIVHLLVSHEGCNPDLTDAHGQSPFCDACALGHLDIVKLLIETGKIQTDLQPQRHPECCKNKFYSSTLTPFGYACGEGHLAVVQYLLQQGQSNLVNKDILMRASQQGHEDIVDLLRPILAINLNNGSARFRIAFNPTIPRAFDVKFAHDLWFGKNEITCVQFSPDGKCFAIGLRSSIQIYVVATGVRLCTLDGTAFFVSRHVNVICFSPDGKHMADGGDELIRIWDISTRIIHRTLRGKESVNSLSFAHDGRTIASVDSHGTVQLWDIDTLTPLITLSIDDTSNFAISPDAKLVAEVLFGGGVRVWNILTSQLVASLGNSDMVSSITFSPNGRNLVGSNHTDIKMWDLEIPDEITGKLLEGPSCIKVSKSYKTSVHSVRSVALTSDAQWMISGSFDGEVLFWDCHKGEIQLAIRGYEGSVRFVAASPIGDYFATVCIDGRVRIWSCTRI